MYALHGGGGPLRIARHPPPPLLLSPQTPARTAPRSQRRTGARQPQPPVHSASSRGCQLHSVLSHPSHAPAGRRTDRARNRQPDALLPANRHHQPSQHHPGQLALSATAATRWHPASRCDREPRTRQLFRSPFIGTLFIREVSMEKLGSRFGVRTKSSWSGIFWVRNEVVLALIFGALLFINRSSAQTAASPGLPSETPSTFNLVTSSFDYVKRDVMIPMRDGVKLHTVIILPQGVKGAPILLTRTPYSASALTSHAESSHLGPILNGYDNATEVIVEGGYIRVVQDVRGKYGAEGEYVMNRPLHGPLNPTPVDHATDTYDTIDWLVKNAPESNGKVGILGISYDGFTTLMALVNPHPALKVAVPMNPMVDGWMGDDWFHNGAFRQQNMGYIYDQEATRANDITWWTNHFDDYDVFMEAGSAGELGRRHGLEQVGFWRKMLEHPSYDEWWQDQAMDRILAAQPLTVPTMLVASLWDQEDIYGAPAVYKALKAKDTSNDKLFLVLGPWHHAQEIGDASSLGPIKFNSDTGLYFREEILRPFLDRYLKDGTPKDAAPRTDVAPVTAFETGTNTWRRLPAWPAGCASGCTIQPTPLYLTAGLKLSLAAPKPGDSRFDEYVSDPAKPVPFRARPIQPMGYSDGVMSPQWLVDGQREASRL